MHPDFDDKLAGSDPKLFFGLSGGWTKTDLKRAYAALIRKWKPEKFPEEFKRIRSAYDRLVADIPESGETPAPETPHPAPEAVPETPRDKRLPSEILAAETPETARAILETRKPATVAESIALARLRFSGAGRPGYDLATLANAINTAAGDADLGPLVGVIEHLLSDAPDDPRAELEAFAPFETTPFYFDITAGLWTAFSKRDPDPCLMRLDRLIHFTDTGRNPRMPFFLLRFCVSGAMRLPPAWLERQSKTLHAIPGFADAATPNGGRIAAYDPLKTGPRRAGDELDFLDAFIRLRKSLDAETRPEAAPYRTLLNAWCDGDIDVAVKAWCDIAGDVFGDYVPVSEEGPCATPVMFRLRQSLDELVVRPEAPAVPPGIRRHEWAIRGVLVATFLMLSVLCMFTLVAASGLIAAFASHAADTGSVVFLLVLLIISVTLAGILAWHGFSRVRRKRLFRLLLYPATVACLRGKTDYARFDEFLRGAYLSTLRRQADKSPAIRFRFIVFPGSKATPRREPQSRRKLRPPSAQASPSAN